MATNKEYQALIDSLSGECERLHKENEELKALSQEPTYYPPCIDCNKKMDEIRRTYDKLKEQEPCTDAVSREAVDKYIVELLSGYLYDEERKRLEKLSAYLWELPSVNPQPCDDAISREAVFNAIEQEDKWLLAAKGHNGLTEIAFSGLKGRIDALPPVTQKYGKWITEKIGEGRKVYCSECKESAVFEYVSDGDIYSSYGHGVVKKTKYCPNCGAKMIDPQESEIDKHMTESEEV